MSPYVCDHTASLWGLILYIGSYHATKLEIALVAVLEEWVYHCVFSFIVLGCDGYGVVCYCR